MYLFIIMVVGLGYFLKIPRFSWGLIHGWQWGNGLLQFFHSNSWMALLLSNWLIFNKLTLLDNPWTFTLLLQVKNSMSINPLFSFLILLRPFIGILLIFCDFKLGPFHWFILSFLFLVVDIPSPHGIFFLTSCVGRLIIGLIVGYLLLLC